MDHVPERTGLRRAQPPRRPVPGQPRSALVRAARFVRRSQAGDDTPADVVTSPAMIGSWPWPASDRTYRSDIHRSVRSASAGEARVVRGPVERRVVFEVDGAGTPDRPIASRLSAIQMAAWLRRDRLQQDPAVALHLHRALAHAELVQLVQVVGDLRGDEQPVAGAEAGRCARGYGAISVARSGQVAVDLGDRRGEPVGVGGEQLLDAGQRYAGLGQRLDLDQVDGVLRRCSAGNRRSRAAAPRAGRAGGNGGRP